ncbi:MAG: hypothetical protein ABS910_11600 [Arthrobacter sp.]
MNSKKPLLAAAAGLALLGTAGCGSAGTAQDAAVDEASGTPSTAPPAGSREFQDGQYTAAGTYIPPSTSREEVKVSLTLQDGMVTELEVSTSGNHPTSKAYQREFTSGVQEEVVGKPIDELDVDKIATSSLTSSGFNKALDAIMNEAAR